MVLQIVADIACSVISGLVLRILAGIDVRWGIDIRWGVGTYLLTYDACRYQGCAAGALAMNSGATLTAALPTKFP